MTVPKTFPVGKIRLKMRHQHICHDVMLETVTLENNLPSGGGGSQQPEIVDGL